jgi:hypothetical protein
MTVSRIATRAAARYRRKISQQEPSDFEKTREVVGPEKVQRIITDEPIGVAVGFRLTPEELEELGVEADEWDLVSDDGGLESEPVLLGDGNEISIRPFPSQQELDQGITPLGQDLAVWRSKEELIEDLA